MASNKTYVSISELKSIAKSLETQREQIYNTYKNKVVPVLESSDKCFYVAGLSTKEIISNFNTIFGNVNTRLTSLINVLNNDVIAQYNEISAAIAQMFNKDFASRLRELLNLNMYIKTPVSNGEVVKDK
ncbi:MAG: hypothetical protein IKR57_02610 [Bacilli bacterium]|nr:hypothetical protein [Bacilli bacterium]